MAKIRYHYTIMTLADAPKSCKVFVPNSTAGEAVEIWRWLSGRRKDFPRYNDHDVVVVGLDPDAWCSPQEYRAAYCPPTMTCIVRNAKAL